MGTGHEWFYLFPEKSTIDYNYRLITTPDTTGQKDLSSIREIAKNATIPLIKLNL